MNLNMESNENPDFLKRLIALTKTANSRAAPLTIGHKYLNLSSNERLDILIYINNVLCEKDMGKNNGTPRL